MFLVIFGLAFQRNGFFVLFLFFYFFFNPQNEMVIKLSCNNNTFLSFIFFSFLLFSFLLFFFSCVECLLEDGVCCSRFKM